MAAVVKLEDLLGAMQWVSGDGGFGNAAYVHRESGRVYWAGAERVLEDEDELPEDLEDERKYVPVPGKQELDLGRGLALRFVEAHLPVELDRISHYFSKPGAYSRFKERLSDLGQLEAWYEFESSAVARALAEWAAESGLKVEDQVR